MLSRTNDGWRITARRSYDSISHYVRGVFGSDPATRPTLFGDLTLTPRRLVFVDAHFHTIYRDQLTAVLARYGVEADIVPIGPGEECKTPAAHEHMLDKLEDFGVARIVQPVLVWGGGGAHDGAGYAAHVFDRGVQYLHYGTTLTSGVDSGPAIKVGAHKGKHRNGLGGFHPAETFWFDYDWLRTNSLRSLTEAMAEVIKIGVIKDPDLFHLVLNHGADVIADKFQGSTPELLHASTQIVERAAEGILGELAAQPFEDRSNQRPSWWGHSFPLIERIADDLMHGEAVALDGLVTIMIAWRRGLLGTADRDLMVQAFRSVGLPLWNRVLERDGVLEEALRVTTVHRWHRQEVPVPVKVGEITYLNDISSDDLTLARDDLHAVATAA